MITKEFNGHTVCNAVSAMVIYYPKLTNGGDMVSDVRDLEKHPTRIVYFYAAFRQAADKKARDMSVEDLVNELPVEYITGEKAPELFNLVAEFIGEKSGQQEKNI